MGILTFGTGVSRSSRSLRCARTPVPPPPLDAKTFASLHRVRVGAPLPSRDRRRCRFVEQTLRAAALRAAPRRSDAIALASSILTGALHVRRRIAGVFAVLVTLAVIRCGRGCFAATAVAIAQLPHHHAERLRRRADHARGPGPASTGIVDLIAWLTRGAAHSSKKLGAMPVTVAG